MNLTARRDLRAYVAVLKTSIDHLDENGKLRATLTFKNFGKTSAYSFAVSADIGFVAPGAKPREQREPTAVSGHLAPVGEYDVRRIGLGSQQFNAASGDKQDRRRLFVRHRQIRRYFRKAAVYPISRGDRWRRKCAAGALNIFRVWERYRR